MIRRLELTGQMAADLALDREPEKRQVNLCMKQRTKRSSIPLGEAHKFPKVLEYMPSGCELGMTDGQSEHRGASTPQLDFGEPSLPDLYLKRTLSRRSEFVRQL